VQTTSGAEGVGRILTRWNVLQDAFVKVLERRQRLLEAIPPALVRAGEAALTDLSDGR
jgi:hypothetical protein